MCPWIGKLISVHLTLREISTSYLTVKDFQVSEQTTCSWQKNWFQSLVSKIDVSNMFPSDTSQKKGVDDKSKSSDQKQNQPKTATNVSVPIEHTPQFLQAEELVKKYFAEYKQEPMKGTHSEKLFHSNSLV